MKILMSLVMVLTMTSIAFAQQTPPAQGQNIQCAMPSGVQSRIQCDNDLIALQAAQIAEKQAKQALNQAVQAVQADNDAYNQPLMQQALTSQLANDTTAVTANATITTKTTTSVPASTSTGTASGTGT